MKVVVKTRHVTRAAEFEFHKFQPSQCGYGHMNLIRGIDLYT